ncbi:S-layer homology domain-containing protein [Paenibacillus sp. NPDC058071]|uniref:S-layer homology domain-containing protein n=1 Tax=Paenibacillus sp. NPDC058071 TaxID=3346326 RepID=UPI0036DC6AD8
MMDKRKKTWHRYMIIGLTIGMLLSMNITTMIPQKAYAESKLDPAAFPIGGGDTVMLAVLPDTQMYSRYNGKIFDAQTEWIVNNSDKENIDFTVQLGDIVDIESEDYQWENAVHALDKLHNAMLPYSYLAGNHDIDENKYDNERSGNDNFMKYVSPARRMAKSPGYGGVDPTGYSSYYTFDASGRTFTVLALDWRTSDATLQWAQSVIDKYPDNPVILTTHEFLGVESDETTPEMSANGQNIWDKLINNNDQVFLTLNGHIHGATHMVKQNAHGKDVLMILYDAQGYYAGGDGFMRQMALDFSNNAIYTKTFSPWVINYLPPSKRTQYDVERMTDAKNQFVVPFDLSGRFPKKTPYTVDGVLAHWKFEDPKDGMNNVKDVSNHGNDLTRVDTAGVDNPSIYTQWSSEHAPLSLSNGSIEMHHSTAGDIKSTYFKTANGAPINAETFQDGYTFEAFIKINKDFTQSKNGWMTLLRRPKGNDGTEYYPGQWPTDSVVKLAVSNLKEFQWETYDTYPGRDWYLTAWSGENKLDEWIHVAAVNDGKTTDLYVNGAHQARNVKDDDYPPTGIQTAKQDGEYTPFYVGNPYNSFNGWIGEIRITDHALSKNEFLLNSNSKPVSGNLSLKTKINKPLQGTLLAKDDDGDPLTYILVDSPAKGAVNINADGTFTYTPGRNQFGMDSFTYKTSDGKSESNTATVTILISPNFEPVALENTYQIGLNSTLDGVLSAYDDNGDEITYAVATAPSNGKVVITDAFTGKFQYVPDEGYVGRDSFTFVASDGELNSQMATINLIVTMPVTVSDVTITPNTVTVEKNSVYTLSAAVMGKNNPSQSVVWSVHGNTNEGTAISSTGELFIAPNEMADELTVTAVSSADPTKQGTATVTVSSTPQPPAAVSDVSVTPNTATVFKSTTYSFSAAATGTNNPSQSVTWAVYGNQSTGTLIDSSGALAVAANETATTLTVQATSTVDHTTSGTATVTVIDSLVPVPRVNLVNVNPPAAIVAQGKTESFRAVVIGSYNPAQTVTWSVDGNNSANTSISTDGVLVVGADETASNLTITATSTVDRTKSGTALVTVSRTNTGNDGNGGGGNNGGGGGTTPSQPDNKTITPSIGGTVNLGNNVTLTMPAGALKGSANVKVAINSVALPPAAPEGYSIIGAYGFTVDSQNHYTFNIPVTLTFHVDPTKVAQGTNPAVYYYDGTKWVFVDGTMDSTKNTITVKVDNIAQYALMTKNSQQSTPPTETPAPAVNLNDIAGNWAEKNIEKLVSMGAISGYSDGSFKPNNTITRAEYVSILVRAFNLTPQDGKVFADTKGTWAQKAIATASYYGIVNGTDNDKFGPNDPITREQMALMIVKAAELSLVTENIDYTDSNSISKWAYSAMVTAVKNNIFNGYPDHTLRPQATATRAEAVTVIVNVLNQKVVS